MSKPASIASNSKKTRMMSILFSVFASTMIAAAPPAGAKSLTALLESREDLSVFTNALKQSPLWEQVDSAETLTIFAPSNAGMREEGSSFLLEEVLVTKANKSRLLDRLALHLAPGVNLSSADIQLQAEINTLADFCVPMKKVGERIRIGPEAVVTEHIAAEDGSLYVINRLLWRPWDGGSHCDSPPLEQVEY